MPPLDRTHVTLPPDVLYVNWDISELMNNPEGTITEESLRKIIKRYELRSALITLGKISNLIFLTKSEHKIGKTGYRDPITGGFVTQFALGYLANIFIISGSNDYKYKKQITDRQNVLALCNVYSNGLIQPKILDPGVTPTTENMLPVFVRMYVEQLETQFIPPLLIARSIVIFTELLDQIPSTKLGSLSKIFENETGLNIKEYYFLVLAVIAASQETATFRKEMLTEAAIPSLKSVLTDAKVSAFLKILSIDYWPFREEDAKMNSKLAPEDTKNRFNPLQVYPIIKTDIPSENPYVIPNIIFIIQKGFWGLYWWFHLYFEKNGRQRDFRTYFGAVFEMYVGQILKSIYGIENVNPEIVYPRGKFIDWWVKKYWKVYLFEVKAYQFPLKTKQTAEIEQLKVEIKTKVIGAIRQMYDRISEINEYKELKVFRWKKLIPVIIFLEMPLISTDMYREIIAEELDILEKGGRKGIKKMKFYLLNIDELEVYESAASKISLEKVFKKYKNNPTAGFNSVIQKTIGNFPLTNTYLGKVYKEFWRSMTGTDSDAVETEVIKENFDLITGKRPPIENVY